CRYSLSLHDALPICLIGGLFGFLGAILALLIGGVDSAFNESGTSDIIGLGWGAFLFSTLAIIGSAVVRSKPKLGGVFLLIAAIGDRKSTRLNSSHVS